MILSNQPAIHFRIHTSGKCIERTSLFLSPKNFTCQILGAEPLLQQKIQKWLTLYAQRKNPAFHLPLLLDTLPPFYHAVLQYLKIISLGNSLSYAEVASQLKNPKAARAVGNACNRNPIPLFIPCHRVVSSDGLGGFASDLEIKKRLLAFEREKP